MLFRSVTMKLNAEILHACVVNPLEDQVLEELKVSEGTVSFTMKPYEIRTLRFDVTK